MLVGMKFRWAKIYSEWQPVWVLAENEEDISFYACGTEETLSPSEFGEFKWGDWIEKPKEYGVI